MADRKIPEWVYKMVEKDSQLIPLDEERCREIEAALDEALEHREQVRLRKLWTAQMDRYGDRSGDTR